MTTPTSAAPVPFTDESWDCCSRSVDGEIIRIFSKSIYIASLRSATETKAITEGNARIIVAAVNSYARLGPNAVALAEADLLGEALEVCQQRVFQCLMCNGRGFVIHRNPEQPVIECSACAKARAVLAKAKGGA